MSHLTTILDQCAKAGLPVAIAGMSGVGKTSQIMQFANDRGYVLLTYNLAMLEAPDLQGIPYIAQDNRSFDFVPNKQALLALQEQQVGKTILVFLDELNRASPQITNALLTFITTGRLGSLQFDQDKLFIVAAYNPKSTGDVGLTNIPAAMMNRFLVVDYNGDLASWLSYMGASVHPVVSSFLKLHPDCFATPSAPNESFASPRTWEALCNLAAVNNMSAQELVEVSGGLVGAKVAGALSEYYTNSGFWSVVPTDHEILNFSNNCWTTVAMATYRPIMAAQFAYFCHRNPQYLTQALVSIAQQLELGKRSPVKQQLLIDIISNLAEQRKGGESCFVTNSKLADTTVRIANPPLLFDQNNPYKGDTANVLLWDNMDLLKQQLPKVREAFNVAYRNARNRQ